MDNQGLASIVQPASPALANALTGPAASLALAALGKSLVGDDQANVADVATAASNADPDVRLKIRSAEEQLLSELDSQGLNLALVAANESMTKATDFVQLDYQAAQDRHDARQRQITMNDKTNSYLAYVVTAGFFSILGVLLFYPKFVGTPPDPDVKAVLQTMLGVLGTAWVGVMTFYFGSSVGSKEKNALLEESVISSPGKGGS